MTEKEIINWLMDGDPSVRWQVMRDLLGAGEKAYLSEQEKTNENGWCAKLLSYQDKEGTWGGRLYSPKWTSTTYTLLQLRRMGLDNKNNRARKGAEVLIDQGYYKDGGINFFRSWNHSEVCVSGIVLSILSYFGIHDDRVDRLTEFLLGQQMADGGWNCENVNGAVHSSFHSTLSVLEGLWEYIKYTGKNKDVIIRSMNRALEFMLMHRLYKSDKTGEIVDPKMTRFSFPPRWRYDVMKGLDFFRDINAPKDERLTDAVELLKKKRNKDGTWNLQQKHSGRIFFDMEKPGRPGRWNTLRALRILRWWEV